MDPHKNGQEENVNIDRTNVERKEQPSLVGATFIKYAAYIIILLIVLYFIVKYVFPKI
jgi:4-hydroxybenzoate polyprenyltransferase